MDIATLEAFSGNLSPVLYGFGIGAIVLETLVMKWQRLPRDKRSRWLSVWCGALAFGTEGLVHATLLFAVQLWVYEHRFFELGTAWWVWILCFLVNDLMFYVSHRLQHEHRLLWAVHCVHHSPKHYDLTTGIRGSALGVFATFPFVVWIPLLGIHPLMFLIVDRLFKFYGLAYHTESVGKLGWVDRVLITPSVHRVHHATNPQYLDRNYGGFFVLFDRLLGTWVPEEEEPVYGLVKDWNGTTLADAQLHEFKDLWADMRGAPSVADSLRYLVKPPGWHPEARVEVVESLSG